MKSFVFLMIYWFKTKPFNNMSSQCPSKWGLKNKGMASLILYTSYYKKKYISILGCDRIRPHSKKSIDSNVFATDELPLFYARPFAACHFPILLFNFPMPLRYWSKIRTNARKITTKWSSPHFSLEKRKLFILQHLDYRSESNFKGFFSRVSIQSDLV